MKGFCTLNKCFIIFGLIPSIRLIAFFSSLVISDSFSFCSCSSSSYFICLLNVFSISSCTFFWWLYYTFHLSVIFVSSVIIFPSLYFKFLKGLSFLMSLMIWQSNFALPVTFFPFLKSSHNLTLASFTCLFAIYIIDSHRGCFYALNIFSTRYFFFCISCFISSFDQCFPFLVLLYFLWLSLLVIAFYYVSSFYSYVSNFL